MWAQIGGLQMVEMAEEIGSGGVGGKKKKKKTGTHGSQRLDQLVSLLGGSRSFLSQIHARTKSTQLSPICPRR